MIFLALFSALLAVGHVILAIGLNRAPQGCETLRGFSMVWCNETAEVRNVVCIWAPQSETPAFLEVEEVQRAA